MGLICHRASGRRAPLIQRMLVGRSREADLRIDDAKVSAEHAVFMWDRSGWVVKDLASRNGTSVDGEGLTPGAWTPVRAGAIVKFGGTENHWRVESIEAPEVAALRLRDGHVVCGEDGQMAWPEAAGVQLVTEDGEQYWLEATGERTAVADREVVNVQGEQWRLSLPDLSRESMRTMSAEHLFWAGRTTLRFEVSRDEEHVQVSLLDDNSEVPLRSRSFDYMLLLLARARLADRGAGTPLSEQGWVYADVVARGLGVEASHLNVDIFRARRRFAAAGVTDADDTIERRQTTRQLRLGFRDVELLERAADEAGPGPV